ncbi:hypothetical protein ACPXCG_04310 [Gordonia sp. DT218]|uniref:hypothetical protein n=1 Tax=Gordonia sp. DT218 TaxID=3416659 RepID=UPI003CED5ECF
MRTVDELITEGGISKSTWQVLASELDEQQILDVIFTVGAYDTIARMFNSLELEIDDDVHDLMAAESDSARRHRNRGRPTVVWRPNRSSVRSQSIPLREVHRHPTARRPGAVRSLRRQGPH